MESEIFLNYLAFSMFVAGVIGTFTITPLMIGTMLQGKIKDTWATIWAMMPIVFVLSTARRVWEVLG